MLKNNDILILPTTPSTAFNIGEIKENYEADLIGVKGNPLNDISLLEKVHFVMKDGEVIK